ncbi:unnamed protein product, partial [Ectocarpus fasciculatus]
GWDKVGARPEEQDKWRSKGRTGGLEQLLKTEPWCPLSRATPATPAAECGLFLFLLYVTTHTPEAAAAAAAYRDLAASPCSRQTKQPGRVGESKPLVFPGLWRGASGSLGRTIADGGRGSRQFGCSKKSPPCEDGIAEIIGWSPGRCASSRGPRAMPEGGGRRHAATKTTNPPTTTTATTARAMRDQRDRRTPSRTRRR